MKFAVICSKKDIAGQNIRDRLLENNDFRKSGLFQGNEFYSMDSGGKQIALYTINDDTIYFEAAEQEIIADYFIFITRHQSKSGEKTLSLHFPGNFGRAEYGGRDREFCMAPMLLLKSAFRILNETGKGSGYDITMEATHHGPYIKKPVMFIEIGSREEEWADKSAGKMIAATVISAISSYEEKEVRGAIGFGGLHYCNAFNKIGLDSDIALGHICPKYNIVHIDSDLIKKMISSCYGKIELILLDWKGMDASSRHKLISLCEELKIAWKKAKEI